MSLWTNSDWAVRVGKDTDKVADYFRSKGYKVLGVSNGKPEIDTDVSAERMQELAIEALSGKVAEAPSTLTVKNTRRRK